MKAIEYISLDNRQRESMQRPSEYILSVKIRN
jgi:hypothetical protein